MVKKKRKTLVGGQALIEGLSMRGPEKTCVAIRQPDGTIYTEVKPTKKNKAAKIPFVRGVVSLINSLSDGYKNIIHSAEIAFPDQEETDSKFDRWIAEKFGDKASSAIGVIGGVLGAALAVLLFIVVPTFLTGLLARFVEMAPWVKALIEGLLKIGIFILYLFAVTRMNEIHRVFEYHGAEHKTINTYENVEPLTVANVRKNSRFHPRCGTSFIFIVLIVSIIIFAFIPWGSTWVRAGLKILALPLIMGISYEIIMFAGSYNNFFCRMLAAPGKWVQRLTTFEPDDEQIAVAIAAFKEVEPGAAPMYKEGEAAAESTEAPEQAQPAPPEPEQPATQEP